MPPIRFQVTTRTIMMLVAFVACGLAYLQAGHSQRGALFAIGLMGVVVGRVLVYGPRLWQHRDECLMRARRHESLEMELRKRSDRGEASGASMASLELMAFHASMRKKWLRGALRPWIAVTPDPPCPESGGFIAGGSRVVQV
ncbi:hypothetical protein [Singulisphaera sp. PoT]|uniref:hypothetical protein n=1 Tax=Singulisphaera sp. PoT TaxID=3411797 RepID=UPI003BF4B897